jgi:hypothetical protein
MRGKKRGIWRCSEINGEGMGPILSLFVEVDDDDSCSESEATCGMSSGRGEGRVSERGKGIGINSTSPELFSLTSFSLTHGKKIPFRMKHRHR